MGGCGVQHLVDSRLCVAVLSGEVMKQKPDWKDAPEWANYLAQDADGDWFWYEHKPECSYSMWGTHTGRCQISTTTNAAWKSTLEERPK